jgi:eukaryotic-like serine/threonine-protein kinase
LNPLRPDDGRALDPASVESESELPETSLESPSALEKPSLVFVPDHTLLQRIGSGSYGEVWLARNALSTLRAVKVIFRQSFAHDRPFEREFNGIHKFEPISRSHEGLVDILQVGRNEKAGYF